eukprot:scaffold98195_cov71-Attheya_sp.AAC.2
MTRSSVIWANDVEVNDLGDHKPTSSRASTSLPFDDTRDDDEDFFDVETGWYVPVSVFLLPIIYLRNLKFLLPIFAELEVHLFYDATKRFARLSAMVITLFPVPPTATGITPANEREKERKKMRDRDATFDKKYFDEGLRDKKLHL